MRTAGRLFLSFMIATGLFALVVAGSIFAAERGVSAQAVQPEWAVAIAAVRYGGEDALRAPPAPAALVAESGPGDREERWGELAPPTDRVTIVGRPAE